MLYFSKEGLSVEDGTSNAGSGPMKYMLEASLANSSAFCCQGYVNDVRPK